MGHGQSEHKSIGIEALPLEMQQATQGQRQNENIDQQQIQRKQPDRAPQVRFVDVFDNDDLELARQKNDGQPGKQDHRRPRPGTTGIELEQARQFRAVGSTLKEIGESAKHAVSHEQAHRHEGDQLDHRLESHRCHHAFVALGGIEMARSEKDSEQRQHGSNQQSGIEPPGQHALVGMREKHAEAGRNRLQLKCNVRHDAHHGNHGHQTGEQLTLAIARSNEIGNRSNALRLADADHLDDDTDEQQHQRRTEINGQEGKATRGGPPDTAVKGPGRAIDGQRQGIHIGRDNGFSGIGPRIAETGNSKKQPEIGGCQQRDKPAGKHLLHLSLGHPGGQ